MNTMNENTFTEQQLNSCSKEQLVVICKVLMEQNKEISAKPDNLIQQINLAKHHRFGSSSEKDKYPDGYEQISLCFNEAEAIANTCDVEPEYEEVVPKPYKRKKQKGKRESDLSDFPEAEHWDGVDVDKAYHRYFEISIDLAKSGIYSGIAHPDCIKLFGHKPSFSLIEYYDQLASALAINNMYAEQSSGAYRRCPETAELGMDIGLIKSLKSHKVKIQTASDAHCPKDVGLYIAELERNLEV
jgi:histidinol-phosphatase (PHP family)